MKVIEHGRTEDQPWGRQVRCSCGALLEVGREDLFKAGRAEGWIYEQNPSPVCTCPDCGNDVPVSNVPDAVLRLLPFRTWTRHRSTIIVRSPEAA